MVRVGRRIFSTIKKSWDNFVPKIGEIGLVNVSPCARQSFSRKLCQRTKETASSSLYRLISRDETFNNFSPVSTREESEIQRI